VDEETKSGPNEARPTLARFVEDNHKLLTVLGAFTAMTVFATNLPVKPIGFILAFLFMSMSILVWLEVWSRFPSVEGTGRLTLFENLLSYTLLILVGYWLVDFRPVWDQFLALVLWIAVMSVISALMKHYNVFNRMFHTEPGKRRPLRFVFGIALILTVFLGSFFVSRTVGPRIDTAMDSVYGDLMKSSGATATASGK